VAIVDVSSANRKESATPTSARQLRAIGVLLHDLVSTHSNCPDHGPHGDDGSVTVYILAGAAANTATIDAAELTINVTHDGQPEQFTLAASPEDGNSEGKSPRFISSDAELGTHLDEEGATAKLIVMIEGTSFSGAITHDHGHEH
jgi:hypothetical protein